MNRGSTLFLRLGILALGALALLVCALALPVWWDDSVRTDPEYGDMAYALYGILAVLYVTVVPFLYALYQGLRILNYIDKNKAFSLAAVKALKRIAVCATVIGIVYAISLPLFYIWAEHDDAPGLVVIAMIFAGAPLVVAVFAAVLQRLLREAIRIKSENDLTV